MVLERMHIATDNDRKRNVKYGISANGPKGFDDIIDAITDVNEYKRIQPWSINRKRHWLHGIMNLLNVISGNNILKLIDDIIQYKYNDTPILNQLASLQKYHNVGNVSVHSSICPPM